MAVKVTSVTRGEGGGVYRVDATVAEIRVLPDGSGFALGLSRSEKRYEGKDRLEAERVYSACQDEMYLKIEDVMSEAA